MSNNMDDDDIEMIDEEDVPAKGRGSYVVKLLKRIGKGKAMVLPDNDRYNFVTIRMVVRNLQRKGKFKQYEVTQRTKDGVKKLYIVHKKSSEE